VGGPLLATFSLLTFASASTLPNFVGALEVSCAGPAGEEDSMPSFS
jgi:hypothetical protein